MEKSCRITAVVLQMLCSTRVMSPDICSVSTETDWGREEDFFFAEVMRIVMRLCGN